MKDYTLKDTIKISNKTTSGGNILISAAATLVIGAFLFKHMWNWTIPELFPVAVEQGLILEDISWLTVLKVTGSAAILMSVGSIITGQWGR